MRWLARFWVAVLAEHRLFGETGAGMGISTLQKDLLNDLKSVFCFCSEKIWNGYLSATATMNCVQP